jgi:hypothetical protein
MIDFTLEDKHSIEEVSALTGINKSVIQEVYEFTFINIVEKFSRDPEKAMTIRLPLIGDLYIKYSDDEEQSDGSVKTNFNTFISLSQNLKSTLSRIIDDLPSDISTVIDELIQEKIDSTIFSSLESE